MPRRLPSLLVLCVFATRVVGPSLAVAAVDRDEGAEAREPGHVHGQHDDGAPCPDGEDGPCDEGCGCFCCPGHTVLWSPPAVAVAIAALPAAGPRLGEPSETFHPDGDRGRVFRPPRA